MNDALQPSLTSKDRCLEEALHLMRAKGPDAVSLREVARRAGLSSTAPYRHFENKEAMLAALAARGFSQFELALRSACAGGIHLITPEQFHQMGLEYINFAQCNPEYYRLMFTNIITDREQYPELQSAGDSAFQVLLQSIEVLQRFNQIRAGDPVKLAAHIWSICHGFASLYIENHVKFLNPERTWQEEFSDHFQWTMRGISP